MKHPFTYSDVLTLGLVAELLQKAPHAKASLYRLAERMEAFLEEEARND